MNISLIQLLILACLNFINIAKIIMLMLFEEAFLESSLFNLLNPKTAIIIYSITNKQ